MPALRDAIRQARPHKHRSSGSKRRTLAGPPHFGSRVRGLTAALFLPSTPTGVTRPTAPRAHAAPPAARATPVRERGRRGGHSGGGDDRRGPLAPDPTTPVAATGASGGSSGFVLILLMALAAAVTLLDPAGLGMRVAAAASRGRDGTARRIDRPG
jgi:hypothetical protein